MEAQARGGQTDTVVANISAVSLRYGASLALDAKQDWPTGITKKAE